MKHPELPTFGLKGQGRGAVTRYCQELWSYGRNGAVANCGLAQREIGEWILLLFFSLTFIALALVSIGHANWKLEGKDD